MTTRLTDSAALWLEVWPNRLTPLVDLICIPGAGAGASAFRPWHRKTSGFIAMQVVQLPGRENRIDEAPASDLDEVVECISSAYLESRTADRPVMVFGHSMGGVIGFELVRSLQADGIAPTALVMSSTTPPAAGNKSAELSEAQLKQLEADSEARSEDIQQTRQQLQTLDGEQVQIQKVMRQMGANVATTTRSIEVIQSKEEKRQAIIREQQRRWEQITTQTNTKLAEIDQPQMNPGLEGQERDNAQP